MMSAKPRSGYLFKWSIENFSFCGHEMIHTSYFSPEEFKELACYLVLYPRGESEGEKNIVCYFRKDGPQCYVDYKIEIIGPCGKVLTSKEAVENYEHFNTCHTSIEYKIVRQDIEETGRDVLTICCHLYKLNTHILKSFEREVCTVFQIDRLTFKWIVPCSDQKIDKKEIISFPSNAQFSLNMFNNNKDIRLIIKKALNLRLFPHFVKLKLTLLEANGNKGRSWTDNHIFVFEDEVWEFPLFLTITEVESDDCKYVRNGRLFFLCDFSCFGGILSQREKEHYTSDKMVHHDICRRNLLPLQEDLQLMFKSKNHCDIKLKVANGDIIEAHKCILASRSPVFSSMFNQDMLETQTGIVDIPDIDVCTLNSFLNFLYTDTVLEMNYESATNLIIIADKYQVISLKQECAAYLESKLSVENACEVAALADMMCNSKLKLNAVDFIAGHSKIIFTKPEWLPWVKNNIELATEIFSKLTETVILS